MIINFCPTGMVPTKEMTPHVPLTTQEIVTDIDRCVPLGVNMAHVHVRDEGGMPHYSKDRYGELIGAIRERHPDLTLCVSCSGRNHPEFEQRSDPLDLKGDLRPDMASLTLSSLNFAREASMNAPDMVTKLAEKMAENEIRPELEVFDLGMMNFANYLISKGVLRPPYYFNIILGNLATAQATPAHLAAILAEMPPNSIWCLGGIGAQQLRSATLGILYGNGARIGLEDNIWLDDMRTQKATNADLVSRIVKVAAEFERKPYSIAEVRKMLAIAPLKTSALL